jgi:hypothetical protein
MFCFLNDSGLHFPDHPAVRMPRPVGHARASGISRGGALTEKWQKKQINALARKASLAPAAFTFSET